MNMNSGHLAVKGVSVVISRPVQWERANVSISDTQFYGHSRLTLTVPGVDLEMNCSIVLGRTDCPNTVVHADPVAVSDLGCRRREYMLSNRLYVQLQN